MTSSRDLPNPGIEPMPHASFALTGMFFTARATQESPGREPQQHPTTAGPVRKTLSQTTPEFESDPFFFSQPTATFDNDSVCLGSLYTMKKIRPESSMPT